MVHTKIIARAHLISIEPHFFFVDYDQKTKEYIGVLHISIRIKGGGFVFVHL